MARWSCSGSTRRATASSMTGRSAWAPIARPGGTEMDRFVTAGALAAAALLAACQEVEPPAEAVASQSAAIDEGAVDGNNLDDNVVVKVTGGGYECTGTL